MDKAFQELGLAINPFNDMYLAKKLSAEGMAQMQRIGFDQWFNTNAVAAYRHWSNIPETDFCGLE